MRVPGRKSTNSCAVAKLRMICVDDKKNAKLPKSWEIDGSRRPGPARPLLAVGRRGAAASRRESAEYAKCAIPCDLRAPAGTVGSKNHRNLAQYVEIHPMQDRLRNGGHKLEVLKKCGFRGETPKIIAPLPS